MAVRWLWTTQNNAPPRHSRRSRRRSLGSSYPRPQRPVVQRYRRADQRPPHAHPGQYPIAITVWDAWGRASGVRGTMVVPVQPTATPTALPTATPLPTATLPAGPVMVPTSTPTATAAPHTGSNAPPQAPAAPNSGGNPGSGPVVVDSTAHVTTSPPEAPRQPLGNLPLWGGAAAAFLAAWAASRRKVQPRHIVIAALNGRSCGGFDRRVGGRGLRTLSGCRAPPLVALLRPRRRLMIPMSCLL